MEIEDHIYTPVKPNFYSYNAKQYLFTDVERYLETNNLNQIKIIAYEVNNDGVYPFLQFLLFNDILESKLTFPILPINSNAIVSTEKIFKMTINLFSSLKLSNDVDLLSKNIVFDGFYQENGELFLFVDVTRNKLNLPDIYFDSFARFVLVDEIFNQRRVCNIIVDRAVTNFFSANFELSVLKDDNNEPYEVPLASYVGQKEKLLNFTYTFRASKQNRNAFLGPYYYFTDFENAIRQQNAITDCGGGVVRFAVFAKKMKYIENLPNDNIDESETKKMKLQNDDEDGKYERLTMRITDYDGTWAEKFDSCYLGDIELDNGEYLKNVPILVVKEYNQQIPLSYHYSKKTTEVKEYAIV